MVPAAAIAALAALAGSQGTGAGRSPDDVSASQSPPAKARVWVRDNYFDPRSTEIAVGGLVTWRWRGENRHNIRFTKVPQGAPRKGASLRDQGRWKRKFRRPGVYRYVCKVWSGMRGTVTVRPKPEPEPEQ